MDAIISRLPHVRFGHIEKVYDGGFCYRVAIDTVAFIHSLVKSEKAQAIFAVYVRQRRGFLHASLNGNEFWQIFALEQFDAVLGSDDARWRLSFRNGGLQCYIRDKIDLQKVAENFGTAITEVLYPRSDEVLTELARPTRMKEAKAIYRKSLFWGKYRWRVSIRRANDLNAVDPNYEDLRAALATSIDAGNYALEEQQVYLRNEADLILLRMGFTHCIKKIEKVILQEDFNASDVAPQTR